MQDLIVLATFICCILSLLVSVVTLTLVILFSLAFTRSVSSENYDLLDEFIKPNKGLNDLKTHQPFGLTEEDKA